MVWDSLLVSFVSCSVSLPRVLSTPSLWIFEEGIKRKVWFCGNTAQQHWCMISSVPATSSEHSTSRAAVEKADPSPDTSTTAPQRSQAEQRAAGASTVSWSGEICSPDLTQLPSLSRSAGSLLWHWRQGLVWTLPWISQECALKAALDNISWLCRKL